MTDSPAIDAQALTKWFGRAAALRDVSLTAPWGCAVALFGANGAGKSTLLRALAGLTRPDRGAVSVAGYDARRQAAAMRGALGYLGHHNLLYADLTARENLAFYANLYGVADGARRAAELLDEAGLTRQADLRVSALSNGMQRRLGIARTLLHRPAVLLLDEPDTGLDEGGAALLERVVRGAAAGGACVVMATHAVDRGLALADRVWALADGRAVLDAAAADAPRERVRALLGAREEGAG